jgi:NAD-dependent dihydropyrimidine dehydrogenase PreA subunit
MRLSTFSFPSYEDREKAANAIYYNCNGYSAYETGSYDGHYILHILEECNDVQKAVKICMANLGARIDY